MYDDIKRKYRFLYVICSECVVFTKFCDLIPTDVVCIDRALVPTAPVLLRHHLKQPNVFILTIVELTGHFS